jgi:nucleoid DNA-binding protein
MIPGDAKKNDGLSDELAERLSIGVPEARRILCAFSRAMAGELLSSGTLFLGGVGSFSVSYVPSEKKSDAGNTVYTSPRNRVVFDPKGSGRDDSKRILPAGIFPGGGDTERFRRALLAVLAAALRQKRDIRLKGFGTFAPDAGSYCFFPERSFEELMNREYFNLDEVVLPARDPSGSGTQVDESRKNRLPLIAALMLLLAGTLAATFYLAGIPQLPQAGEPAMPQAGVPALPATAKASPDSAAGADDVHRETSGHDSLVLAEGDYTIVLATFRAAGTAAGETVRLRSEGLDVFVWPASVGGRNYFRIATGKYSEIGMARAALAGMPEHAAGGACIQKVIKRIVLHGEK